MPTSSDYENQIIREVGDPNGTLTPVIGTVWGLFADRGKVSPDLQYLYTKRAALDQRLAEEQPATDFALDANATSISQSQKFTHLQQMRVDVQAEIVRIEMNLRARRVARTGALTTTESVSPPVPGGADASDLRYGGSPYARLRRPI